MPVPTCVTVPAAKMGLVDSSSVYVAAGVGEAPQEIVKLPLVLVAGTAIEAGGAVGRATRQPFKPVTQPLSAIGGLTALTR